MIASRADCYRKLTVAIRTDLYKIHDGLADLKMATSAIMNTAAVIKNQTIALHDDATIQRKREILEWICPGDHFIQHRDYIDRRQTETGEWFLQDPRYQEWVQSEQSTLFCPGMPGAGKTMMAALVIDQLLRSEHEAERPVVFIYCSYKRQSEQSIKHMLSTLLRQSVDFHEGVPPIVQEFCKVHARKRTTPSTQELEQILRDVTKDLLGITILVDALDECEARTCRSLLSTIEALRAHCKVRFLGTSRPLPEIQSHPAFLSNPSLEVRASDSDVELYVRSRVSEFRSPIASKANLLEVLVSSIVNATRGM
jgi:Cdc6-like AAA superfamily ATPase